MDYLRFMGFCGVFWGNSIDACASVGTPPEYFSMPFHCNQESQIEYREYTALVNGIPIHFVEQKYGNGIIRWRRTWSIGKVAFFKTVDNPESAPRKMRSIEYYALNNNPEKLREALGKCKDPSHFIGRHPNLLVQVREKFGSNGEDCQEIIDLLVDFGYPDGERIEYLALNKDVEGLREALGRCRNPDRFIDRHPDLLLQFKERYDEIWTGKSNDADYLEIIGLLVDFGYPNDEYYPLLLV
jgi:hypothetical protein